MDNDINLLSKKRNNLSSLQQKYKELCRAVNYVPAKKEPKYPTIQEPEVDEEIDSSQLQALLTTKLEELGGSGHINTLFECAAIMFPFNPKTGELLKVIKEVLSKNTDMYEEKEPSLMKGVYWLSEREIERRKSSMKKWKRLKIGESVYYNFHRKNESLREILFTAILKNGPITCNYLADIVKFNWDPPFINMNILTIRDMVDLILTTDPIFDEDVGNPMLWTISKKHKKNIQKFSTLLLKTPPKDNCCSNDDLNLCKCGVKLEGSPEQWKRGSSGEYLCTNCCETKGKVNSNESPSEDNPWIQCDKCGSWIIASSDGISDLSIYDDSNPNHLDYYCPPCRKKDGLDAPHLIIDEDDEDEKVNSKNSSRQESSEEEVNVDEYEEVQPKRSTRKRRKSYSDDN